MKPGQQKNKGSAFEREIGKKLSLWLSGGQRKDLICRTVLSGGQFTLSGCGNAGDLMAQHPDAFKFFEKFVLECKHWKDVQMIRFLVRDGDLYKALRKVEKQAKKECKFWMLVARQNHQKIMVFIPIEAATFFYYLDRRNYHILFNNSIMMFYFDEFLKTSSFTSEKV